MRPGRQASARHVFTAFSALSASFQHLQHGFGQLRLTHQWDVTSEGWGNLAQPAGEV
jgi:hypothetical protein